MASRHTDEQKTEFRRFVILAGILVFSLCTRAAGRLEISTEEFMVPAVDPGIELYVRNKHPARAGQDPPLRARGHLPR